MTLPPNTILQGRYEIVRVVGQGGLGAVYEAIDQRLHARVAIKQLTYLGAGGAATFEREARLLSQLRHPNLPRVSDYFSDAAGQFLVMDFIEGRELGELLRLNGRPLPAATVSGWMDQLLGVLEYLHRLAPPILHRDIKPGNIKLAAGDQLMLLDFGLAKGHSATPNLSVMGYTPHYAPLEQMQGAGTDVRSDLYAVAATAYHLLTEQPPADALTRAAASIRGQPDPLLDPGALNPALPGPLAALLLRNLAQDPDRRHPSAQAFRQALQAAQPGASAAAPPFQPASPISSAGMPTLLPSAAPLPPSSPTAPTVRVQPPASPSSSAGWPTILTGAAPLPPSSPTAPTLRVQPPASPSSSAGWPTILAGAAPLPPSSPTAPTVRVQPAPTQPVFAPLAEAAPPAPVPAPPVDNTAWTMLVASLILLGLIGAAWALNGGYQRLTAGRPTATAEAPLRQQPAPPPRLPQETAPLPELVTIRSSLPRSGEFRELSQHIVNGITMRLEEDKSRVCGPVQVRYLDVDDALATKGGWDEAAEALNADGAARDPATMVYIGPYDSGAARVSIPILNRADLVMISPGSTYPGLTKQGLGAPGEPELYYPTQRRTYARVIPTDELQGVAAAHWAKALGARGAYIVDDGGPHGAMLADAFAATAEASGLPIVGRASIDPQAQGYAELVAALRQLGPDLIYFSGTAQNNAAQLLKDIRAAGLTADQVKFMGSDGIRDEAFLREAGAAAEGIFLISNSVPPDQLAGAGTDWLRRYRERFAADPDANAAYGYEAASVALAGLNASCADLTRSKVREMVMATERFDGLFGRWGFDANGDTTLRTMSGLRVRAGRFEFLQLVEAK